jgi:hypothetical protein
MGRFWKSSKIACHPVTPTPKKAPAFRPETSEKISETLENFPETLEKNFETPENFPETLENWLIIKTE